VSLVARCVQVSKVPNTKHKKLGFVILIFGALLDDCLVIEYRYTRSNGSEKTPDKVVTRNLASIPQLLLPPGADLKMPIGSR
jgi:hypothetical protein